MKKSFLMMVGAAILVSCSQSELVDPVNAGDVTIEAKSVHKLVSGEVSRAPFVGTLSETNSLVARVLTAKATGDYGTTNLHANGKMVFVGGSTTSSYVLPSVTEAQTKFPDASTLYMCGLYPLDTWSVAGTTASISFTGKEDVMSTPQVTTTATQVAAGTVPSLVFSHSLTKLEVKLKAVTNAANGTWGKITKIEVLKASETALNNVATVTLATGATAFSGTATSFTMFGMSETAGVASYTDVAFTEHTLTETATPVAYTMISPFTSDGTKDLTLRVTSEYLGTKEVDINLTTYSGPTKGYAFGITLTFDVDPQTILASAVVNPWVSGGDVEQGVEF